MNSSYISPFAKPVYIMLKPIGSVCNLACEYCYYLEKSKFYPDVKNHIMTDQILEKFIKEYMECQTMQEVLFTWHGGETLMRPISFYKKALELQRKYAGGRQIDNCIQTSQKKPSSLLKPSHFCPSAHRPLLMPRLRRSLPLL